MALAYQPTAGRILVKPLVAEEKTKGGIYLPETAKKETPQEGEVVAVGPDLEKDGQTIKAPVKKADKILYAKWGGEDYKDEAGTEYKFIKFDDIIAVAAK
jgi:chaperonin GroES